MDWPNPVEWCSWIYGKFFAGHPLIGFFVVAGVAVSGVAFIWMRGVDRYYEEHPRSISGGSQPTIVAEAPNVGLPSVAPPAPPPTTQPDILPGPPPGSVAVEVNRSGETIIHNVTALNAEKGVVTKDTGRTEITNVTHDPLAKENPYGQPLNAPSPPTALSGRSAHEMPNAMIHNVEIRGFAKGAVITGARKAEISNVLVNTDPVSKDKENMLTELRERYKASLNSLPEGQRAAKFQTYVDLERQFRDATSTKEKQRISQQLIELSAGGH